MPIALLRFIAPSLAIEMELRFLSASATILALSRSLPYIVLRRRFSSYNSFVHAISEAPMLPNLERYL